MAEASPELAPAPSPAPAPVRVIQLSDIHFGGEDKPATEAALRCAWDLAPDLTVVTGDLTLNGKLEEFQSAAAWLAELPSPRVATPGNHDTPYWNLALRTLTPFDRYRRYIGATTAVFDSPRVRLRAVNTARGPQPRLDWSKGAIKLDEAQAIATAFQGEPLAALRLVACHHPLLEMPDSPVTGGVRRGHRAAAILARGGIDLILTGHVHVPFALPLAAGDGLTHAIGAATLSLRLRGAPAGFNQIEADAGEITVTAQGWTGKRFEPWRVWRLPRRVHAAAASA